VKRTDEISFALQLSFSVQIHLSVPLSDGVRNVYMGRLLLGVLARELGVEGASGGRERRGTFPCVVAHFHVASV